MSESNRRIFSRIDHHTGLMGWFFKSSEGIMGPYESEEEALAMLGAFIESWKKTGTLSHPFAPSAKPPTLPLGALTAGLFFG
jgi:hypothetical protein